MSNSVWPHRQQPTRLHCPWDSPGENTGVGCHFLLQCMKVKRESEVAQSCPTRSDPMDCSLPGSSVHGIFQARILEWVAIAFSSCLVAKFFQFFCDSMDYNLPGSSVHGILQARMLEWVVMSFCRGPSQPRDQTHISHVSCIGRQILYHWVTREAQGKWVKVVKLSVIKVNICCCCF